MDRLIDLDTYQQVDGWMIQYAIQPTLVQRLPSQYVTLRKVKEVGNFWGAAPLSIGVRALSIDIIWLSNPTKTVVHCQCNFYQLYNQLNVSFIYPSIQPICLRLNLSIYHISIQRFRKLMDSWWKKSPRLCLGKIDRLIVLWVLWLSQHNHHNHHYEPLKMFTLPVEKDQNKAEISSQYSEIVGGSGYGLAPNFCTNENIGPQRKIISTPRSEAPLQHDPPLGSPFRPECIRTHMRPTYQPSKL